jgi:hypothetical protein
VYLQTFTVYTFGANVYLPQLENIKIDFIKLLNFFISTVNTLSLSLSQIRESKHLFTFSHVNNSPNGDLRNTRFCRTIYRTLFIESKNPIFCVVQTTSNKAQNNTCDTFLMGPCCWGAYFYKSVAIRVH